MDGKKISKTINFNKKKQHFFFIRLPENRIIPLKEKKRGLLKDYPQI